MHTELMSNKNVVIGKELLFRNLIIVVVVLGNI
jgi:hypothetical protein